MITSLGWLILLIPIKKVNHSALHVIKVYFFVTSDLKGTFNICLMHLLKYLFKVRNQLQRGSCPRFNSCTYFKYFDRQHYSLYNLNILQNHFPINITQYPYVNLILKIVLPKSRGLTWKNWSQNCSKLKFGDRPNEGCMLLSCHVRVSEWIYTL